MIEEEIVDYLDQIEYLEMELESHKGKSVKKLKSQRKEKKKL
jgi:hypothetical protein